MRDELRGAITNDLCMLIEAAIAAGGFDEAVRERARAMGRPVAPRRPLRVRVRRMSPREDA